MLTTNFTGLYRHIDCCYRAMTLLVAMISCNPATILLRRPNMRQMLLPECDALDSISVSNYIHYKMWDEITYPFLNFNGATVEV